MSHQHKAAKARRREGAKKRINVFRAVWCYFVDRSLMLRLKYHPRNYTNSRDSGSHRNLNLELLALAGGADTQQFSMSPSQPRAILLLTTFVRHE